MTVNDWLTALAAAACAFALAGAAIAAIVLGRKVKAARTLAAELAEFVERLEQTVTAAWALQLLRPPRARIGAELAPWQSFPGCPDCGSSFLDQGPRGGASINLNCRDCGTRWNAVPPMRLIQRI